MVAITPMVGFLFFLVKTPKSENSSDISSNYYNRCNLLTTKEAKMQKSRKEEEERRELEGGVREER